MRAVTACGASTLRLTTPAALAGYIRFSHPQLGTAPFGLRSSGPVFAARELPSSKKQMALRVAQAGQADGMAAESIARGRAIFRRGPCVFDKITP